jgi:hypothetical protein
MGMILMTPTSLIINPVDFYRNQAVEYARLTATRFNNAVRPIYGKFGKFPPEHIGSAIFIKEADGSDCATP